MLRRRLAFAGALAIATLFAAAGPAPAQDAIRIASPYQATTLDPMRSAAARNIEVYGLLYPGASLGFLGMGAQPPLAEWGVMIADGQSYVVRAWWICFFPGLAAVTLGIGLALTGDGLARLLR